MCQTVERDCVADQRRTPSESLLPQAVTQHDDRSAIEITRKNGATVRRADAEQREEVRADDVAANQLGAIGGHHGEVAASKAGDFFEALRLSVSNSLSGRDWELDQVPAVGDPTHIV